LDVNDCFLLSSVAELPKRETSRRKAKENSSTRRIMQERLLEDDEEMPGLDLSDSDDDATWTPFKEKGAASGGIASLSTVSAKLNQVTFLA